MLMSQPAGQQAGLAFLRAVAERQSGPACCPACAGGRILANHRRVTGSIKGLSLTPCVARRKREAPDGPPSDSRVSPLGIRCDHSDSHRRILAAISHFLTIDRQTPYLFPPSIDEWLPQNHLARFIVEAIERLDTSRLEKAYQGRGRAAYHPALLLSLLVYGYAAGVFSSRRIERATYDSVVFRFIAAEEERAGEPLTRYLANADNVGIRLRSSPTYESSPTVQATDKEKGRLNSVGLWYWWWR